MINLERMIIEKKSLAQGLEFILIYGWYYGQFDDFKGAILGAFLRTLDSIVQS